MLCFLLRLSAVDLSRFKCSGFRRACPAFPPLLLDLCSLGAVGSVVVLKNALFVSWTSVRSTVWSSLCPRCMVTAGSEISFSWLLIHNAESLLKRFTLLCTFWKWTIARSGLPRIGYISPFWTMEWQVTQLFVWKGEVGMHGELPQRVSAATLLLLELHCPNKNLGKCSPGRESSFPSSLKPVRNLVFWEHGWELFTNTGSLLSRWLMSINCHDDDDDDVIEITSAGWSSELVTVPNNWESIFTVNWH